MWVSRQSWNDLCNTVFILEERVKNHEKMVDMKILEMAKRILRQPEELSKEIENDENIEEFVKKFIND